MGWKAGLCIGWILVMAPALAADGRQVTVVSGTVRDGEGHALGGVAVHAEGANLSDVSTDPRGWFRLAVVDSAGEIPLRFSRLGFLETVLTLQAGEEELKLDVVMNGKRLAVGMSGFERGRRIRGTVSGLAPGEHEDFKVLVYVLTNKWYIHPQAVATPGSGFALIDEAGGWEIETVWRGHQAIRLALLVVPKETWAPPIVEPGESAPDEALRGRLVPVALLVLEAPEGI